MLFLDLFQYKNHIWHINKNFIFLAISPLSIAKGPYDQFHKTQDNIIISGEEPEQHSDSSGDEEGSLTDDDDHDDSDFDELSSNDDKLFAAPDLTLITIRIKKSS